MKAPTAVVVLLSTLLLQSGAFAADAGMQMQEHVQEMETLMVAIKAEKDPQKLEALMQQHMEMMRAGVEMMSMDDATAPSGMTMENRMHGMEQRMDMMGSMMEQMMERDKEMASPMPME